MSTAQRGDPAIRVLLVCMGNICRSPMAQGVLERQLRGSGLEDRVAVDSAGTHAYHLGERPDGRARAAAARRDIDIGAQRARQVRAEDFGRFDYILAMDRANHAKLLAACPPEYRERVALLLDFAPGLSEREVPDPYYGGARGFEKVLDMVELAIEGLIEDIRTRLQRGR